MGPIELFFRMLNILILIGVFSLFFMILGQIHLRIVCPNLNRVVRASVHGQDTKKDKAVPIEENVLDLDQEYEDGELRSMMDQMTAEIRRFEKEAKQMPEGPNTGMREQMPDNRDISELGLPTRIKNILSAHGIETVSALSGVCQSGELRTLKGIGEKTEAVITAALEGEEGDP